MLLAESHGKLPHPYRVFSWDTIASEYLETTPRPERDKKEMLLEMRREQAKFNGINPMKVKIEKAKELNKDLTLEEDKDLLIKYYEYIISGRSL